MIRCLQTASEICRVLGVSKFETEYLIVDQLKTKTMPMAVDTIELQSHTLLEIEEKYTRLDIDIAHTCESETMERLRKI